MSKYLMLDRRVLNPQAMENVSIQVTPPEKDVENNPLMVQDKPWEIRIDNGYPNVIYDKEKEIFRCYYTLFTDDLDTEGTTVEERSSRDYLPRLDRVTSLAYAESKDGIHWEKPSLNRVEWRGSKANNILFLFAHGTGVMLDEHSSAPDKKYKMVTKVDIPGHGAHMAVAFSSDGLNWSELIPWPEHNPPADSHNLPFWDEKEGCYMLLSRIWKDGIRMTTLSRSDDFIHWSEPKETLRGRGFEAQVYSMPVFFWNNLYLGLASIIHEGDRTDRDFDMVDCELTWAAEPEHFDFAAPGQSLIPRGRGRYPTGDFDCGCIYASRPVFAPNGELWLYYMGGNGQHTNFRETSLARALWRADRFAALEPKREEEDSLVTTCRMKFEGESLEVLAEALPYRAEPDEARPCEASDIRDTRKGMDKSRPVYLEAQVHRVWTEAPVPGFTFEESRVSDMGDGWKAIQWPKGFDSLAGTAGCIKLKFRNLKIWAVRGDICLDGHRLWEGADMENEGL